MYIRFDDQTVIEGSERNVCENHIDLPTANETKLIAAMDKHYEPDFEILHARFEIACEHEETIGQETGYSSSDYWASLILRVLAYNAMFPYRLVKQSIHEGFEGMRECVK